MALKNPKQAELLKPKRNKYGARGFYDENRVWWASKWEWEVYQGLLERERKGEIRNLVRQLEYSLMIPNQQKKLVKVAKYVADAAYWDTRTQKTVVIDAKSKATMTAMYRLKRKLMDVLYGIKIVEVFRK